MTDIMVACDHFEEHGPAIPEDWFLYRNRRSRACWLHYPSPELIAYLDKRLPSQIANVKMWNPNMRKHIQRVVHAYPLAAIRRILKFLGVTAPSKDYTTILQDLGQESKNEP
jgi:hypothetical protein